MEKVSTNYSESSYKNLSQAEWNAIFEWHASRTREQFYQHILEYSGITLGIMAVVMNSIFLILCRYISEKPVPYIFIRNLSVADVLASCSFLLISSWPQWMDWIFVVESNTINGSSHPGDMSHSPDNNHQKVIPLVIYMLRGLPWLFFTGYLLTLTALTINQYLAVCRPYRYSTLVTPGHVLWCIVIIWLVSALQMLVPFGICMAIWKETDPDSFVDKIESISQREMQVWLACFIIALVVNIAFNIRIYFNISRLQQHNRLRHTPSSRRENDNLRLHHDTCVTTILLIIATVFFRLPLLLTAMVELQNPSAVIHAGIELLLYLNFFLDPIIYIIRLPDVRRVQRNCMHRVCCWGSHLRRFAGSTSRLDKI